MALRQKYGVRTGADEATNRKIFASVRSLAEFVVREPPGGRGLSRGGGDRVRVLLVSANRMRQPYPVHPIGLDYVAAALEPAHEVRVLDLCPLEDR